MSKVSISGNSLGTGTLTIAAPNTNTDRTLTLPDETGTVITSATANVYPKGGPAFSSYANTTQSFTTATFTKVTLGTEAFDTNNNFASSTFTPTVAGYYQINGCISVQGSSTITRVLANIYKNGALYCRGDDIPSTAYSVSVSNIIYLNGSTDYVELYVYATGTSLQINGASDQYTYFSGVLVRAA